MKNINCWFCGGHLIWQNDFNTEDYGIEEEGIVTVLTCSDCGAVWEGTQIYEEAEE